MSSRHAAHVEVDSALVTEFLSKAPAAAVDAVRFHFEPAEALAVRMLRARKLKLDAALQLVTEIAQWRAEKVRQAARAAAAVAAAAAAA